MTPEGRVKEIVKRHLDKVFGDKCYRFMPVQMGLGAAGLDFYLCIGGRFIAIETKTKEPGSKLTARQEAVMEAITLAGGLALVVRDNVSMDAAVAAINEFLEGGR